MPAPYELPGASYDWDDAPADVTAAAPAIAPIRQHHVVLDVIAPPPAPGASEAD